MDKNLFVSHNVTWKMEGLFFDNDTESPVFSLYGIQWKLKLQIVQEKYYRDETHFEIHLSVSDAPVNYLNVNFIISSYWKRNNGITSSQDTTCVTLSNIVSGKTKKLYENSLSGLQNIIYQDLQRSCNFATCIKADSFYFVCSIKPDDNGQASLGLQEEQYPILSLPCADSLARDFGKALYNSEHTDVVLKCRDKSIAAHKAVLSCRSEVFQAMFHNNLKESQEGIVDITDIEPLVFEQLIYYIYTGNFTGKTVEAMCDIYKAAHKYEVKALKERCICFIKKNLEIHQACEVLIMADTYLENDLKMYVIAYIIHRKDFLLSEKWQTFCKDYPCLAQEVFLFFVQKTEIKSTNSTAQSPPIQYGASSTFEFRTPASGLDTQTSEHGTQTSEHGTQTSGLGIQTSGLGTQTSRLGTPICGIQSCRYVTSVSGRDVTASARAHPYRNFANLLD